MRDFLNFLNEQKRNILLQYPFVTNFLNNTMTQQVFLENLNAFKSELIKEGLTEEDIISLEDYLKNPEKLYEKLIKMIDELIQKRKELENRKHLLKELEDVTYLTDIQYHQNSLNEDLQEYKYKVNALPLNFFGRVKDKKTLQELQSRIRYIEKKIKEIPARAESYKEKVKQLVQKLHLPSDISYEQASKLSRGTHNEIEQIKQQIRSIRNQRRELSIIVYSLEEAQAIFNNRIYGPADVYNAFGIDLRKQDIPTLPDKAKMKKAGTLGSVLALRVYGLIYGKEALHKPEWKIFLPEFLPTTIRKDYIEQTKAIRDYLLRESLLTREELMECADEKLERIRLLSQTQPEEAIKLLVNLKINQNHRHSPEDIMYFNKLIHFPQEDFEATNADPTVYRKRSYPARFFILVGRFPDHRGGDGYINGMEFDKNYEQAWGVYNQGVRLIL